MTSNFRFNVELPWLSHRFVPKIRIAPRLHPLHHRSTVTAGRASVPCRMVMSGSFPFVFYTKKYWHHPDFMIFYEHGNFFRLNVHPFPIDLPYIPFLNHHSISHSVSKETDMGSRFKQMWIIQLVTPLWPQLPSFPVVEGVRAIKGANLGYPYSHKVVPQFVNAKLVYNFHNYGWLGWYIYTYMVYTPSYNWGGTTLQEIYAHFMGGFSKRNSKELRIEFPKHQD